MYWAICIRKRRCDKVSFEFLHNVDNEPVTFCKTNKDNKIIKWPLNPLKGTYKKHFCLFLPKIINRDVCKKNPASIS